MPSTSRRQCPEAGEYRCRFRRIHHVLCEENAPLRREKVFAVKVATLVQHMQLKAK
jgi:hypothetical protein